MASNATFVARAIDSERASLETLNALQVPTPSGRMVPLRQFATLVEEQEFPLVWRRDRVPTKCPQCGGARIRYFGVGTEKVEAEIQKEAEAAKRGETDPLSGRRIPRRRVNHAAQQDVGVDKVTGHQS